MLTAMADRTTERRWLEQLTALPTAPGHEDRVMAWARSWVGRRSDLTARTDRHGNLLITQKGRLRRRLFRSLNSDDALLRELCE